jgi:peptidyl-prolyl cis-trans isomerase C
LKAEIEDGADFAAIAKQHSQCPSGQRGGDLGEFGPGQMVKEFDTVVFSAEVGKVVGPVKTQFGYHLIEVTSRTD